MGMRQDAGPVRLVRGDQQRRAVPVNARQIDPDEDKPVPYRVFGHQIAERRAEARREIDALFCWRIGDLEPVIRNIKPPRPRHGDGERGRLPTMYLARRRNAPRDEIDRVLVKTRLTCADQLGHRRKKLALRVGQPLQLIGDRHDDRRALCLDDIEKGEILRLFRRLIHQQINGDGFRAKAPQPRDKARQKRAVDRGPVGQLRQRRFVDQHDGDVVPLLLLRVEQRLRHVPRAVFRRRERRQGAKRRKNQTTDDQARDQRADRPGQRVAAHYRQSPIRRKFAHWKGSAVSGSAIRAACA